MIRLSTRAVPDFPLLAWLASVDVAEGWATVVHGNMVEAHETVVVEGVWPGPYSDLGFVDSTDFFGSGVEVREREVWFSPSRALVDRLILADLHPTYVVSNSLPLLLAAVGARLRGDRTYVPESHAILSGIHDYDPGLPVVGAVSAVAQYFHTPFSVSFTGVRRGALANPVPFATYDDYRRHLEERLDAIVRNATDHARKHPIVEKYVALSGGYDSSAVAALLAHSEPVRAFTSRRSNSSFPAWLVPSAAIDDGTPIADALSIPSLDARESRELYGEQELLAAAATDSELVFSDLFQRIRQQETPALLFTGYHGDKVWSRDPGRWYLGTDLRRGDISGLPLAEARLSAGAIHVAVPFIGARAIRDLVAISNSDEMAGWSVGGDYDRPIPRRLVETAGVPRNAFGRRKKAIVKTYALPRSAALRRDFLRWLRETHGVGAMRYRLGARLSGARWYVGRVTQKIAELVGNTRPGVSPWSLMPVARPDSLLFRWANERLAIRARSVLERLENGGVPARAGTPTRLSGEPR